jgi:hypothetical protein
MVFFSLPQEHYGIIPRLSHKCFLQSFPLPYSSIIPSFKQKEHTSEIGSISVVGKRKSREEST